MISLAVRHQHDLSCIVLDVDHFKRVNDTLGHATGDEVLKTVAAICQANLRASDLFGRLGGEEFAIMLPHVDAKGALAAAEKLRAVIAAQTIHGDFGQLAVTASFGTAALSPKGYRHLARSGGRGDVSRQGCRQKPLRRLVQPRRRLSDGAS